MGIENRRKAELENDYLRLTLLTGGGHIAAVTLKSNGVNPLWDPIWETIEPSAYDPARHGKFGAPPGGPLLAGIAGHNLCFDLFGEPSEAEAAAGLTAHGEASAADWQVKSRPGELTAVADLTRTGMRFERRLSLSPAGQAVVITESAENLGNIDRPVGWTEHVTMGPPFLKNGKTRCHMPATRSKVYEKEFADGKDRFPFGDEFAWPQVPLNEGGTEDLRTYTDRASSAAYTCHLMDPAREQVFFTAHDPGTKTLFGYIWRRRDFPWIGIWEENHLRQASPWDGRSLTRGMEFGVSPMPETRREMVDRGRLFGEPCYRWIPARSKVTVEYCLFIAESPGEVTEVTWEGGVIRGDGGLKLSV